MSKTAPSPVTPSGKLPDKKARVDLVGMVQLIHRHLTKSLCEEVFRKNRTVERQRKWTLHALAEFWVAVIIRAPQALRHALIESYPGQDHAWPNVGATPEAFFEKCQGMHWSFFSELFKALSPQFLKEATGTYAQPVQDFRKHFPEIWVMDGSQLGEVAHRLKILWKVRAAVLPGRLFIVYDLLRGVVRTLRFEPDAARNENLLAQEAMETIPEGTLILADRLYGTPGFFQRLSKRKSWGISRRNQSVRVEILKALSRKRGGRELLEDVLVKAGTGKKGVAPQQLRLIRYRHGTRLLEVFTNVLDTEKLPAERVVELYGQRWSVERMFFDLKEVLNLNRFYAANPNAIAMQVYAAAIVYNAFRIIQARIAQQHGLAPEMLSPAKLYPKLAITSSRLTDCELMWLETVEANPEVSLVKPGYARFSFASTTLGAILVEKKFRPRTKGIPNPPSTWLSYRHVRGGQKWLTRLS